ncbi:hypothetical protein [Nonomuraea sp. NPDC049141]|uniref:hypothetical protein n=1 Tax=Nonomuraea sp. NPDC049141 TaxID=3155500 RepID=UPI0033C72A3B
MATTCLAVAFAAVSVAAVPASASASKAPDFKACFDGTCKITITTPVKFRVSRQFGFTWLSITRVDSSAVRVQGTGLGASSATTLGVGGTGSVNSLSVKVPSITETSATIHLAPL